MSTAGGKGGSHCPGMFIPPPTAAFIHVWIMQCHASEATFASVWRVCEGNFHSYTYTCTNRHYPGIDCSPRAQQVGGSGATASGCCTSVSLGGLGSLGSLEPVMLPVSAAQSSSLGTTDFIGQCVGFREVFNQLNCRGGLDLVSVFPRLDCVCVCACVYGSQPLPWSVTCGGASGSHSALCCCWFKWLTVESDD